MRNFAGIDLGCEPAADKTTVCKFWHLLKVHNLGGKRDPKMHQTKKDNEPYCGVKGHIGVDSQTKLIRSVAATAANVHDSQSLGDLSHGDETRVWGDFAYAGQCDVIAEHAPRPKDFTNKKSARNRSLVSTRPATEVWTRMAIDCSLLVG